MLLQYRHHFGGNACKLFGEWMLLVSTSTDSVGADSVGTAMVCSVPFCLFFPFCAFRGSEPPQAASRMAKQEIRIIDQLRVKFIFIVVAIESKIDKFCSNFVVWR